jgi:hypothetical protein
MDSPIQEIELDDCFYEASCAARGCDLPAIVVACSFDAVGQPSKQYELCGTHARMVAERERRKGKNVVDRRF